MGRLYTSLPLDNPARQFYQNVIDNSRKQLVSQMASDRGKVVDGTSFDKVYNNKAEEGDKQPLAAQVKDGKIVDTWINKTVPVHMDHQDIISVLIRSKLCRNNMK